MKRVAIFAHFDAQGEVKRFVLHHLKHLSEVCQNLVFVSNSPIAATQLSEVRSLCSQVQLRENSGYDFSMWKHGMISTQLDECDELILTNSSVFGPFQSLRQTFDRMRDSAVDFWGLTENTEFAPHIQSYFLAFRRSAIQSEAFGSFWSSVLPYRDKHQTIRAYEIGLTTFLVEQGLRYSTLVPWDLVKPSWPRKRLFDQTLTCPLDLLKAGMPYVKVALLRDNPRHVNLNAIYRVMQSTGYDHSLVEFDRARASFHVDGK